MRLLLISNSGRPYLAHCRDEILDFIRPARRLAFVTAASLGDEEAYHETARAALGPELAVEHMRWDRDPFPALARAEAVFVGGGNTYALLRRLRQAGLLGPLRERVQAGLPYIGASAGANLAGPNVLTTNDWNVVGLTTFEALGVVPFNVNPHYLEADPAMAPGSETRDMRIAEYHVLHDNPVAGIEEGGMVRMEGDAVTVRGASRVKLFRRGQLPTWVPAGSPLLL
ncbi:MAG: dipeptidase PepE [Candidatus Rokuibacteriota bacterium]